MSKYSRMTRAYAGTAMGNRSFMKKCTLLHLFFICSPSAPSNFACLMMILRNCSQAREVAPKDVPADCVDNGNY